MTAEELAEIRKRHASDQRTYEYTAESAGSTRPFGGFGPKQHKDRLALLTHTDAQAQRIAELEAQLAARGPDRYRMLQAARGECEMSTVGDDVPERFCMNDNCMCERIIDAILSSGALATAQAEQRQGWFCPNCGVVPGSEVTFHEYHQTCGAKVSDSPAATAQAVTLTEEEIARAVRRGILNFGCAEHSVFFKRMKYGSDDAGPTEEVIMSSNGLIGAITKAVSDRITNGASTP